MNLKTYIERGEKTAGSQKALGELLGVNPSNLRNAKAGQQGLPVAICYQLAELIGEDERRVVAASELVTEKKPERRAVLLPFVGHALTAILAVVILEMTPTPANALPAYDSPGNSVYDVKWAGVLRRVKQWFLEALKMTLPEPFCRPLVVQVAQVAA
jgi:hypothetical protein